MTATTWTVVGSGQDTRIAEIRLDASYNDEPLSYEQAKQKALHVLHEHSDPYFSQIKELESDAFKITGKLPNFKAWRDKSRLVIAKTKKRAMELTHETRYSFDADFIPIEEAWWYPHAAEEGVWLEERKGNSKYRKPIDKQESKQIATETIAVYSKWSSSQLAGLVNNPVELHGVSSQNTPYKLTVKVSKCNRKPGFWRLEVCIDDLLDYWGSRHSEEVYVPIVFENHAWKDEGF